MSCFASQQNRRSGTRLLAGSRFAGISGLIPGRPLSAHQQSATSSCSQTGSRTRSTRAKDEIVGNQLQRPGDEQIKLGGRLSLQHLVAFPIPETTPGIMDHKTGVFQQPRMNTLPHPEIIGLDVSRDWLNIHCLSEDRRFRPAEHGRRPFGAGGGRRRQGGLGLLRGHGRPRMASLGELGGGRDQSAATPSGASRGVREKPGHFGQDGPDRRRG